MMGFVAMTAKKPARIVIVCKQMDEHPQAIYMEWSGQLDEVTTLCQEQWGSGILRRMNEILYTWKKDGEDA